jgi:hypothetical protein
MELESKPPARLAQIRRGLMLGGGYPWARRVFAPPDPVPTASWAPTSWLLNSRSYPFAQSISLSIRLSESARRVSST